MTGLSGDDLRRVTPRAIESWRLCLHHDPQPSLGQFNWPMVLAMALDDLEADRAELSRLREADQRVRALHVPTGIFTEWSGAEHTACCICGRPPWPCATAAALDSPATEGTER